MTKRDQSKSGKAKSEQTKAGEKDTSLFNPGKAQWLQECGADALDGDQQALLLALSQLEAEMGRTLSEDETGALQALAEQLEGFDAQDIVDAMQQLVTKPADPKRKTAWPELKRRKSS